MTPVSATAAPVPTADTSETAVAPGAPSPARGPEEDGWSWFTPSTDGDGLLYVTLAGTTARVEQVPSTGGEGVPIATGHALSDGAAGADG